MKIHKSANLIDGVQDALAYKISRFHQESKDLQMDSMDHLALQEGTCDETP